MRRDDLYLADITGAADAIAGFIVGLTEEQFIANDMLRSAVLHKLTIIGEAAARLSDSLRLANPSVPWRDIIAFRNHVVHRYFGIDWQIVWNSASIDTPALRTAVDEILRSQDQGEKQ